MSGEIRDLLKDARRLIEQEMAWDKMLYATPLPPPPLRGRNEVGGNVTSHPDLPPQGGKGKLLEALYNQYKDCTRCALGGSRIKFVFGVGNPEASVLFIGEGPGYEEDRRGEPFVGKAGQLLDKILASIGLSREKNAYIANIVKCHPMLHPETPEARGNDRPPTPQETAACSPILYAQISIIQPKIIVTLGSPSTKTILQTGQGISTIRGKLFPLPRPLQNLEGTIPDIPDGIQVLPTYHPAALLRNPNLKQDVWTDMKLLRDILSRTGPK